MKAYWLTFTDGTSACCEGESEYDALRIAQHVSGKKVALRQPEPPKGTYLLPKHFQVDPLPYAATPVIWQFDHPVLGKAWTLCYDPANCKGHGSCPKRRACSE